LNLRTFFHTGMLTVHAFLSKAQTLQQPPEMVRILDRHHGAGARMAPRLEPQQPETQGGGPAQRRPGRLLARRQRAQRAVSGKQGGDLVGPGAPVVGGHRQIEQQAVGSA
jgi:hypothetical protein